MGPPHLWGCHISQGDKHGLDPQTERPRGDWQTLPCPHWAGPHCGAPADATRATPLHPPLLHVHRKGTWNLRGSAGIIYPCTIHDDKKMNAIQMA